MNKSYQDNRELQVVIKNNRAKILCANTGQRRKNTLKTNNPTAAARELRGQS